jgi:hypothetical protein
LGELLLLSIPHHHKFPGLLIVGRRGFIRCMEQVVDILVRYFFFRKESDAPSLLDGL